MFWAARDCFASQEEEKKKKKKRQIESPHFTI